MTARLLPFPPRGPFSVRIERERGGEAWMVACRHHGWLHGDRRAAELDAAELARGFVVAVLRERDP